SIQVAKWCVADGADAIHVSAGSFAPHPKNPAGDFPLNVALRTYEALINSGTKTYRNFILMRLWPFGAIFRWWWAYRRGRKIEGILLDSAVAIKQALGSVPVIVTGGFQTCSVIAE